VDQKEHKILLRLQPPREPLPPDLFPNATNSVGTLGAIMLQLSCSEQ